MTNTNGVSELKTVVSVSEMARMLGMSRSRLYQLVKQGILPCSAYDIHTRRPVYTEEQQRVCLEVRRRNMGINGTPILFYSRRVLSEMSVARTRPPAPRCRLPPRAERHTELVAALRSLGVETTSVQVQSALASMYPDGHQGVDPGVLLRSVFRHLRRSGRKNRADNVGS